MIALIVLGFHVLSPGAALAEKTGELAVDQVATVSGVARTQGGLALPYVVVRFEPIRSRERPLPSEPTRTTTDARGRFVLEIPAATAGDVIFRRDGYASERIRVPELVPGGTRELAVTLMSFFTLDAVSVTAARNRPLLNTQDASTGGSVERAELEALPADARKLLPLAFNVPGVTQSTGFFGDAPPLSINGSNSLYTQYSVDGLDNNEGFLGGPRVEFPLAAARRLDVLATTYSAAHGRSPNGVVNVESHAGGEEWSGELFVFGRPGEPLDATP